MNYKIKDLKVNFGKVYLFVAFDKRGYIKSTVEGFEDRCPYEQLVEVGRGLYEGVFQFIKPAKCLAKKEFEFCKKKHGLKKDHLDDPNKYRERFANEFARRMCA